MSQSSEQSQRREFIAKTGSIVIGAAITIPPVVAGLATVLDPARRTATAGGLVFVTSLNAVPEDGIPRQFPVISDRRDAWNKFPQVRVGAVYLRRSGPQSVEAINVVCPHAGCFVNYASADKQYRCPCHNSVFGLDGKVLDPKSPSPRGLDGLRVEIRNGTEVWVQFQNFRAGVPEQVPV